MNAQTDEGKFIRELREMGSNKASFATLAERLGGKWTPELVRAKAEELDRKDSSAVFVVKGGVQYLGVENCVDPGLYKAVERGIKSRWARSEAIPRPVVERTFRLSSKLGPWTRPDLVISSQRIIGGVSLTQHHALEVEQHAGFDIKSVYQAFEQGRGAEFSWVLFTGPLKSGDEWTRIMRAAKELKVGLVHMPKATVPSGWKTKLRSRPSHPKPASANEFRDRCQLLGHQPQSKGTARHAA